MDEAHKDLTIALDRYGRETREVIAFLLRLAEASAAEDRRAREATERSLAYARTALTAARDHVTAGNGERMPVERGEPRTSDDMRCFVLTLTTPPR
jgi:hypothetical protein